MLGTILLAEEGINGSLCGTASALKSFFDQLGRDADIGQLSYRTTYAHSGETPFNKLKVRIKERLLPFPHQADATPVHVEPEDWHQLIDQPNMQLIDVRNRYETDLGAFRGARIANIDDFSALPDYVQAQVSLDVNAPVAMYCTGGIRCEKVSGWLRSQGFSCLYQLAGGILNYLQKIPVEQSRWQGDCFVFDRRTAVNATLQTASDVAIANVILGQGDHQGETA